MASLEYDPASACYRVRFRYDGREFKRSLRTKVQRVAAASLVRVEETLRLLKLGLAEVPAKVDAGDFIVSGARARREKTPRSPVRRLTDLFRIYQEELPSGAKEERTLEGERLHIKHLLHHLKSNTPMSAIHAGAIQKYVELRSKDRYRGKLVGPDTIRKELSTLRLIWNWAKKQGYLDSPAPVDRVIYPKRDEKPPFMTMAEVDRSIAGKTLSSRQITELWEALYLTRTEVEELLQFVAKLERERFVYPMFVLAAHTGMRRSELVRSERIDLDFEGRIIQVREKKRSRKHSLSFRRVPMTNLVSEVFQSYFRRCNDGPFTLCRAAEVQISEDTATNHFKASLAGSPWKNVRGFHVLRHSFASNAAAERIDQRMIDEWMGHQTEEMRRRYRHLFPDEQRKAIDAVFGGDRDAEGHSDAERRAG